MAPLCPAFQHAAWSVNDVVVVVDRIGDGLTKKLTLTDYSIHYFAPLSLLIATMRYIGDDYERDMEGIKESEATRRWWKVSCLEL